MTPEIDAALAELVETCGHDYSLVVALLVQLDLVVGLTDLDILRSADAGGYLDVEITS